jgi:predicted hotdog family 3-hydroxylacyl-ACP dehydratase
MPARIETLIPHRAPMRFVETLTECMDTTAQATTKFTAQHFAVADGAVIETALVECVAQTVAAALGHRAARSGKSGAANNGMLAAVSNFKIHSPPPLDTILTIEVRELKRLGPMLLIAGSISSPDQLIASGELSLYA